jgi:hypothetical protein
MSPHFKHPGRPDSTRSLAELLDAARQKVTPAPGEALERQALASFMAPDERKKPRSSKGLSIDTASRLGEVAKAVRAQDAKQAGEMGFFSQLLVQVNLPHRDPGAVLAWGRRNGNVSFVIQPGVYMDAEGRAHSLGYPYGTYPRLFTAWMATEVVRTGNRQLDLGRSFYAFQKKLHIEHSGGAKGSDARLHMQMRRYFGAIFSWEWLTTGEDGQPAMEVGQKVAPVETKNLFWNPMEVHQESIWNSTITLNEVFFNQLMAHHVPVDLRILRALARHHSSLGIDIYCWLTHRLWSVRKLTPVIGWESLRQQMGTGHSTAAEFARDFKKELNKVLVLYPEAKVELVRGGLRLRPSRTSVAAARPELPSGMRKRGQLELLDTQGQSGAGGSGPTLQRVPPEGSQEP